ncbi:hypothetical protein [Gynuella sunshinyii]|uniref:ABC-type uncharacterized transport system, permease component n=1 Tax=Gynuella sunshinyii YC6258 TaxID=1445510 RepID=A0A0C5UXZ2_9GAMM|nr:hypothetical protein [Gynuella sunshinyii]AJQ92165.1 ABC-type uncharacterized transport system, permease component [Gynuella sunshinyii YC6258]
MLISTLTTLAASLLLGILHAFDPDHVVAVSAMSAEKPGLRRSLRYCSHWAIGHGGVLLICTVLLFGLGLQLPERLLTTAETAVGAVLILIGLLCFWRFHQQHQGVSTETKGRRTPTLVGMLHGLAGSAPALALVPVMSQAQFIVALGYVLVFSAGVLLSMLLVGLGLGLLQHSLRQWSLQLFQWCRYGVATGSVLLGGYWMVHSL